jgi:hypothetical protein
MSTVEQDVANLKTDMAELRAIVRELALSQQRTRNRTAELQGVCLDFTSQLGTTLGKVGTGA